MHVICEVSILSYMWKIARSVVEQMIHLQHMCFILFFFLYRPHNQLVKKMLVRPPQGTLWLWWSCLSHITGFTLFTVDSPSGAPSDILLVEVKWVPNPNLPPRSFVDELQINLRRSSNRKLQYVIYHRVSSNPHFFDDPQKHKRFRSLFKNYGIHLNRLIRLGKNNHKMKLAKQVIKTYLILTLCFFSDLFEQRKKTDLL